MEYPRSEDFSGHAYSVSRSRYIDPEPQANNDGRLSVDRAHQQDITNAQSPNGESRPNVVVQSIWEVLNLTDTH